MRRLTAHSLLLAAFLLGGFAAPSLHQAWHAVEWAHERAEHLADGHHSAGSGAPEVSSPCPKPVGDLQCVLCQGVLVFLPASMPAAFTPAPRLWLREAPGVRAAENRAGSCLARGPPEQVA